MPMKTKVLIPFLVLSSLVSCSNKSNQASYNDFGVFLGLEDKDVNKLLSYKSVAIEIEEFSSSSISKLNSKNIDIYAYLSVGSLESYRDYYEEFKQYTFFEYDHWDDEKWIDISVSSWQKHLLNEVQKFKNLGAKGLFLDNFDVYYIALEEYECSSEFKENIYQGCHKVLNDLSSLNMSILINSGADFLERLNDENDPLLKKVNCYAQECVFSSIIDYEKNIFGKQDKETQNYYLDIIRFMKKNSNILIIEYTKDKELIKEIEKFSNKEKMVLSN